MTFKDHFTKQSSSYKDYRPTYPSGLFEFLFALCESHELAWDCACGSGQASSDLAQGFTRIVASDASQAQIQQASVASNVSLQCFPAEQADFENASVDLITVAQALHWFKRDEFFAECKRVLKPCAPLVVWSYGLTEVSPAIDDLCGDLYTNVLGEYWPPERRLVEEAYQSIDFPFKKVSRHTHFSMQQVWSRQQFIGYLRSWSATQAYISAGFENPLVEFEKKLEPFWQFDEAKTICWPLIVIEARD